MAVENKVLKRVCEGEIECGADDLTEIIPGEL